ncbi:MAG: cupin domain-containing protein [Rhodospirillaceae bacterium]|nr:cupin domain-containing protein [Rhodospirillaceae bacterium]MBT3626577.1 cupin domain-containing protein [Rhodospirillaceae bacterium]MBT3926559.1 cupin domain-containing protein [Rhodospirillaceae bacterium]MBT4427229.1 cupin domain-containing protein [Rhodospirillaceae bacterium]MBT5037255.1 cupin domain-containing protein [Rhodospirillaceae bacterium]
MSNTPALSEAAEVKGFTVSRARDGGFESGGLRQKFEYRDLGISTATEGRFHAQVIRIGGEGQQVAGEHWHSLDFQLVYILKGWITFDYAGVGETRLEAGDCVHQPPGIRHAVLAHSDDLELLEVTSPADFATDEA